MLPRGEGRGEGVEAKSTYRSDAGRRDFPGELAENTVRANCYGGVRRSARGDDFWWTHCWEGELTFCRGCIHLGKQNYRKLVFLLTVRKVRALGVWRAWRTVDCLRLRRVMEVMVIVGELSQDFAEAVGQDNWLRVEIFKGVPSYRVLLLSIGKNFSKKIKGWVCEVDKNWWPKEWHSTLILYMTFYLVIGSRNRVSCSINYDVQWFRYLQFRVPRTRYGLQEYRDIFSV